MATRYLSLALLSTTKHLTSFLSHPYTTGATASSFGFNPRSSSLLRLRPIVYAASATCFRSAAPVMYTRGFATRQTSSSLNDPNPNWSNRPPKETILPDVCDFEHWLVVMEPPEGDITRDDIIDSYIKTLALVVGSEEEARMKIYSVSTRHYFAFGALVSEELSTKLKYVPKVRWVLPDSYLDVRNKDFGGEPFINGQAVPYDPKYHEEWLRDNSPAKIIKEDPFGSRPFRSIMNEEEYGDQTPPWGKLPMNSQQPKGEAWMSEFRNCVAKLVELTNGKIPVGKCAGPIDYSISTALKCLNEMEDIPQSGEMYLDAFEILQDGGERECFICLPAEPRRRWLQRVLHRRHPMRYSSNI